VSVDRRVVLAGNNAASIAVLDLLLERLPPSDVLCITPPQGPTAEWQESLAEAAGSRDVPWIAPSDVNDDETVATVRGFAPTLLLSIYYTQLFSPSLLASVDGPILNFHPSLLPRHRGHAPIIWAIAEGDTVTGLSVHYIDEGIDTGAIVYQASLPIHPKDTGFDVHSKMVFLVGATAAELLRRWFSDMPFPQATVQVGAATTHTRRDSQLNHIDWSEKGTRIRNVVRALAPPLPGAFVRIGEVQVTLVEVEPVHRTPERGRPLGIVELDADGTPLVWASDGPLQIRSVLRDGRVIDARELRLTNGTILQ
jgi:methionyl-tRNA formyltransferase